jgi:hypothetical protein
MEQSELIALEDNMRLIYILSLVSSLSFAQGVPIKSGVDSNLATVNSAKSMLVVRGASTQATYVCSASALVTTALYSMQISA